jgi:hypothetical protein
MRPALILFVTLNLTLTLNAQNRPLKTEPVESVPKGYARFELGFQFLQDVVFPFSGLEGDLTRIGDLGLRLGVSENIEMQIFWVGQDFLNINNTFPAPNSPSLDFFGNSTSDIGNLRLGTKIYIAKESGARPGLGFQTIIELPNASNESGLSNDETDFYSTFLVTKTLSRFKVIGNLGLAILGDPGSAGAQDDLFTYGAAFLYTVSPSFNLVFDLNGRLGPGGIGTEEQSVVRIGAQISAAGFKWDISALAGLLDTDPCTGVIFGVSKDFRLPLLDFH